MPGDVALRVGNSTASAGDFSLVYTELFHIACFCGSESVVSLWHIPISSGLVWKAATPIGVRGVHPSRREPPAISAHRDQ